MELIVGFDLFSYSHFTYTVYIIIFMMFTSKDWWYPVPTALN